MHTKGELKMTGNCLKASRPLLSFDKNFDAHPHLVLIKELFIQVRERERERIVVEFTIQTQGDNSGLKKPSIDLDLECSINLPGQQK